MESIPEHVCDEMCNSGEFLQPGCVKAFRPPTNDLEGRLIYPMLAQNYVIVLNPSSRKWSPHAVTGKWVTLPGDWYDCLVISNSGSMKNSCSILDVGLQKTRRHSTALYTEAHLPTGFSGPCQMTQWNPSLTVTVTNSISLPASSLHSTNFSAISICKCPEPHYCQSGWPFGHLRSHVKVTPESLIRIKYDRYMYFTASGSSDGENDHWPPTPNFRRNSFIPMLPKSNPLGPQCTTPLPESPDATPSASPDSPASLVVNISPPDRDARDLLQRPIALEHHLREPRAHQIQHLFQAHNVPPRVQLRSEADQLRAALEDLVHRATILLPHLSETDTDDSI